MFLMSADENQKMTFCPRCGVTMPPGSLFCPSCGSSTTGPAGGDVRPLPLSGTMRPPPPETTSGMAIASLVSSLLFFLVFPTILAVIFGHLALSRIKKGAGRIGGKGIATAGLVLGYVGIAFFAVILIIVAIAVPNVLKARTAANEASAVLSIRLINSAQIGYQRAYPDTGYALDLTSLGGAVPCHPSPATACMLENNLATATNGHGRSGYSFTLSTSGDRQQYVTTAVPLVPGDTGKQTFCSTEDDLIHVSEVGRAIPSRKACLELPLLDIT